VKNVVYINKNFHVENVVFWKNFNLGVTSSFFMFSPKL
jgi:hypothetical protein